MIRRIIKFKLVLPTLFLLAFAGYLIAVLSQTDHFKPVAVSRSPRIFVKPERQNSNSPEPLRIARVRRATLLLDQAPSVTNTGSSEENKITEEGDAAVPLAFVDPAAELTSGDEQLAELDYLRQEFVELVGGPNQDPATPEYRRRWDDAQRQIDEQFASFFGSEAFNEQQGKAVRYAGQPADSL